MYSNLGVFKEGMRLNMKEERKPIVFTNIPIKDKDKDLLGINNEANRIENAIDEGANIIGIIGDYGTGKSSLIEMLKNKFLNVININMWNSVNTKTEEDSIIKISDTKLANELLNVIYDKGLA